MPPFPTQLALTLALLGRAATAATCVAGQSCKTYCAGFAPAKDLVASACPLTAGGKAAPFCGGRACEHTSVRRSDSTGCACCCGRRLPPAQYERCPLEAGYCRTACQQSNWPEAFQCDNNATIVAARTCAGRTCGLIVTEAAPPNCVCCCSAAL